MEQNNGLGLSFGLESFDGTLNSFGAKIADYDSPYAAFRRSTQDALPSDPARTYRPSDGYVNYADPEPVHDVPWFVRSNDLLTLDPDPFGTHTEEWARGTGLPYDSNYVPGLTVFGRSMTREYLKRTEAGKRLLELEEKKRRGVKRGFLDAITDFELSDLPFLSLFATVAGSVADAATVSSTLRKLQNGEPVTDDELIKTRLYMAETEYRSEGSWGATVGDIIRAAPGFMVEFAATGGTYALARTGAKAAAKEGIHLAMTRATKRAARDAVEEIATRTVKKAMDAGAAGFDTFAKGITKLATESAEARTRKQVVSDAAQNIFRTMWDDAAGTVTTPLYRGLTREQAMNMAEKRAGYEFEKLVARSGSSSRMVNGLNSFTQWMGNAVSRGLLDFGAWGTEEASVLFRKTSAGRKLAEAAEAMFVEAPIKGALLQIPGQIAARTAGAVSDSQLGLQTSAYMQGNRELMDDAESIAFGINMLEYASENAGRGFRPLASALGTGLEKLGVSKLLKPVSNAIHAGSDLVKQTDAVKFGGRIRQWVDDVFGTRETFRARFMSQQTRLVAEDLASKGIRVTDTTALETALRSGVTDKLAPDIAEAIGPDIRAYAKGLFETAYKSGRKDLEYKSMARFMLADFMTRHNIGPQTVMNLYEKMGYDGVLGEMMEERYSDVAKGLLGLDDRAHHDFWSNFKTAVKGLYPGFSQLTAEAVGFMVPMVTRAATMKLMSAVGGEGKFARIRTMLEGVADMHRHPRTLELKLGTHRQAFEDSLADIDRRIADAREERTLAESVGDTERAKGVSANIEALETARKRREEVFNDSIASIEAAALQNARELGLVTDATSEEDRRRITEDQTVVVEPMLEQEAGGFRYSLRPIHSTEHARQGMIAQDAAVDAALELARAMWECQVPLEGESPSFFRSIARKAVGMAGTLVTGDLSLMSMNPAQWIARDMGLDREVCIALKNGYRTEWEANRTRLEAALRAGLDRRAESGATLQLTREEITAATNASFAVKARAIMENYLAAHQLRAASQSHMLDQAVELVARERYGFSGVGSDGRLIMFDKGAGDLGGFDSKAPTVTEFYETHKEEVDQVRDRIALATADLFSNRVSLNMSETGGLINLVRLPAFADPKHGRKTPEADAVEDHMIYTAALRMAGLSGLVTTVTADGNVPVDVLVAEHAASSVNMDIVRYIVEQASASDPDGLDVNNVDQRAIESVAKALNLRFDGTEKSLTERNDYILRLCRQAVELEDPNTVFLSADITRDAVDMRLAKGERVTICAKLTSSGWAVEPGSRSPSGEPVGVQPKATREELLAELKSRYGFDRAESPRAVFTQARIIETEDPIVFLRDLNLLGEYQKLLDQTSEGDQTAVHPFLRRTDDGSGWLYEENSPEYREALARDRALAAGFDPATQRVARIPEGATADDVARAYERMFGPKGYMTVAEALLAAHNVNTDEAVATRSGRADPFSVKRYSMAPGTFRRATKMADAYIPIDFSIAQDYTDAMLNARLMQAYASHPTLLRSALGDVISDYVSQLNALVDSHLRRLETQEAPDTELISELRMFQLQCTRAVDRVDEDGTVHRGVGLSAESFTTLASAFALFQVERRAEAGLNLSGHSRALAVIAQEARELPAFWGFASVVDAALGGSGFAVQELDPAGQPVSAQRGLMRTMSVFFNDPEALVKSIARTGPGGLTHEEFFHACNRYLQSRVKVPSAAKAPAPEKAARLRDRAKAADSGTGNAYGFYAELVSELGIQQSDAPRFFAEVIGFLKNVEGFSNEGFDRLAKIVDDSKRYAEADRQRVEAENRLVESARRVEALEARVRELDGQLARLAADTDGTDTGLAAKREEAAKTRNELDAAQQTLAIAKGSAVSAADTAASIRGGETSKDTVVPVVTHKTPRQIGLPGRRRGKPADIHSDNVGLRVEPGTSTSDPLDMNIFTDDTGLAQLTGLEGQLMSECYGLTSAQARLACNVSVRLLVATGRAVDREGVERAVHMLFPSITESDMLFLLDQFDRIDETISSAGRSWADVVNESGPAWSSFEEDVKDEASSADDSRQFNKTAVAEFNSKELTDFLALAQLTSPDTRRNFQAFALSVREVNRLQKDALDRIPEAERDATLAKHKMDADSVGAVEFLYRLMNPRANTKGKTFNERQAYHVNDLKAFTADKPLVDRFINALSRGTLLNPNVPYSRKGAFLLAYLMTLPSENRERFTQLIANSAVCTPVSTKREGDVFGPLSDATRGAYTMSTETVSASFLPCVGKTVKEIAAIRMQLDTRVAELLKPGSESLRALELFGVNDIATSSARLATVFGKYANLVASVFGNETPLYSSLVSPTLRRYLTTSHTEGNVRKQLTELFRAEKTKTGTTVTPSFVRLLRSVLVALENKATKGRVTSYDVETAALVILSTGEYANSNIGNKHPPTHADNRTALLTFLSEYESSLPVTLMHAEVDEERGDSPSEVVVTSRGVIPLVSRWMDDPEGFTAICKKFFPEADEQTLARCRQDMTWPDARRTPILAKNLSKSYKAFEILTAAAAGFRSKNLDVYYVPVYAGDHASSALVQVPKTVKVSAANWKPPADYGYEAYVNANREYFSTADWISRSLGLSLLWDDTKRAAVSSLESPGAGMVGIKVNADGTETKGRCRVAVVYNFGSAKNEEMLGTVTMYGYGADRVKACAKDPKSPTLKTHLVGTGGSFIAFIKALAVSTTKDYGTPLENSAVSAYENLAEALTDDSEISTTVVTDLDSYKVGPARSKTLQLVDAQGRGHMLFDYIVEKLKERYPGISGEGDLAGVPDTFTSQTVASELLGDGFKITDSTRPGKEFTLDEALPGLEIRKVETLNGPSIAFVIDQNDLTAYTVANVSHKASPESGRTPANHVVDGITMTSVLSREDGELSESCTGFLRVVDAWGDAVTTLNTAPETLYNIYRKALLRDADDSGIAALRAAGEHAAGQFILDEVSKTVYALNRKGAALPLDHIYAPLTSAGASVGPDGQVFCHAKSRMIRDTLRGPEVFTTDESRFYGTTVRRALCGINNTNLDFRHGWYLDEARFTKEFGDRLPPGAAPTGRDVILALEGVFNDLRAAESAEDTKLVSRLRGAICSVFVDHRNVQISKRGQRYIDRVSFADLFRRTEGGSYVFDRSAVQAEDSDLMYNDASGNTHIYLGGTLFGFPRTPSYNGSMWLQVVRAGLPVDERPVEIDQADGSKATMWLSGLAAKVQPDPVTNAILGCDHDGDKAALYMFTAERGKVGFWTPPVRKSGETDDAYRERLCAETDAEGNPYVIEDEETGGLRFTPAARTRTSNELVQSFFGMNRELLDRFIEPGDTRRKFFGLPLSDDGDSFTKADPLGKFPDPGNPAKSLSKLEERILKEYGARSLVEARNLGQVLTAADVTDASHDANEGRAKAVSLARALHVMYASSLFTDTEGAPGVPDSLGVLSEDPLEWLRFIYRLDGVSNATFDDIKNQKCSRLGWTSGTMKALIADLLAYRLRNGKLPVTDAEWEDVLVNFTKDMGFRSADETGWGPRRYVLMNTDTAPRARARSLQSEVLGTLGPRGSFLHDLFDFGSPVAELDGKVSKSCHRALVKHRKTAQTIVDCADKFIATLQEGERARLALLARGGAASVLQGTTEDDALGWVYWLFDRASKADTQEERMTVGKSVVDFMYWKSAYNQVTQGEKTAKTVNYVKANPGDASESGNRERILFEDWKNLVEARGAPGGRIGATLIGMHDTNVRMHYLKHRLESVKARALRSVNTNADTTVKLVMDRKTAKAAVKLLALPALSPYGDKLDAEANAQQFSYILTALIDGHRIFTSKDFKFNTAAAGGVYNVLETIAGYVAKERRGENASPSVLDFRKGIEDAFEIMYRLAVSSKETFKNPAFAYLAKASDWAPFTDPVTGEGSEASESKFKADKYGSRAAGLSRILLRLRGSSQSSQEHIRGFVERIIAGKDFAGDTREHRFAGVADPAKGFALTEANLDAVLDESGKSLESEVKIAKAVLAAILKCGGDPKKGVTPSMMFGQLLPLYTLITTRTLGAPQPQSPSLLGMIPRRIYEALSAGQVRLDDINPAMVDAAIARNFGVEETKGSTKPVNEPDGDMIVKWQNTAAKLTSGSPASITGLMSDMARAVAPQGAPERSNPDFRNTFDIFAANGVLKDIAEVFTGTGSRHVEVPEDSPGRVLAGLASGERAGETRNPSRTGEETASTRKTRAIATALGAAFGSWLHVDYAGGTKITLRGRLSGDAGHNAKAVVVIDVGGNLPVCQDDRQVENLANSYAYAASVVQSAKLGITAEAFLQLPLAVRKAFVKRFSIGGATLNKVSWSIDGKGIATLAGHISLAETSGTSTAFHEMFHQMCAMFRQLDLWGVDDIVALRKEFGDPPPGTDMLFDEEAAAEAFRKFTARQADKSGNATVRTVFQKIYDFLKGLLEILRLGFEYGDRKAPTAETLFKMMLHGIAERTTSTKNETVSVEDESVIDEIYTKLNNDLLESGTHDLTQYRSSEEDGRYLTRAAGASEEALVADVTARAARASAGATEPGGYDGFEEMMQIDRSPDVPVELHAGWQEITAKIEDALGNDPLSVVVPLVTEAAKLREKMASAAGVDLGHLTDTGSVSDGLAFNVLPMGGAPLTRDEYKTELVRAAVKGGTLPGADVNPFYVAGRAITDACINGMKTEGAVGRTLRSAKEFFSNTGARGDQGETANKIAVLNGLRMVMQQVNPALAAKLTDFEIENTVVNEDGKPLSAKAGNLVFEACLSAYQALDASFARSGSGFTGYLATVDPGLAETVKGKRHASPYDFSAWCLVSHGVLPVEHTEACLEKLRELKGKAGSGAQAAIGFLIDQIGLVHSAVSDSTKLADYISTGGAETLDKVIPAITAGLTYPEFDERGYLKDYGLIDEESSDSQLSHDNRARFAKCIGEHPVQEALKAAIQMAFTCKAEIKFYRETGFVPGGTAESAAHDAIAPAGTPSPMTNAEWLASQGVAPGGLLDPEPLIDYYDQSFFIANNVKRWLDSQVLKSFGGREIRDIITANEHEYEALVSDALRERNFLAYLLGFNADAGTELLKVLDKPDEFEMKHGEVLHSRTGNTAKGFDNLHRVRCKVSFTSEELRTVRWYADAVKAWANGERELITGLDRLTFGWDEPLRDPEYYSLDSINARAKSGKNLSRFENLLRRIPDNLNEDLWGNGEGQFGLYDRIVRTVCTAAERIRRTGAVSRDAARSQAYDKYKEDHPDRVDSYGNVILPAGDVQAMHEFDVEITRNMNEIAEKAGPATFNRRMLRELEKTGLIAVHSSDDGSARSGVVVLKVNDIFTHFNVSSAYRKLTSAEGGRDYRVEINGNQVHCLSPEALAKPLMDVWRRTCTFVKQHPWITQGDAKFLNTFETALPMFTGTGYFMYDAVRKDRDQKRDYTKNLGRYERRFLNALSERKSVREKRLSEQPVNKAMRLVEQLKDLYGTPGDDIALRNALVKGDYAEGSDLANRTGLVLSADPTFLEIEDAIYAKLLERSWEQDNHPFKRDGKSSVDTMIDMYRDNRRGETTITRHPTGLPARVMYEKYGVLPANFDLGHSVKVAVDQVTNAIMHRNTIAGLLLTPSADGTPVYYAKPSDLRAEQKSLPDEFWETVARWWGQVNGMAYDDKLTGVQNARAMYDKVNSVRGKGGKTPVGAAHGERHRYTQLPQKDSDLVSIEDWLVQDDEDLGGESTMLNAIGGGEAMGYLRQVCGAGRVLGFGGPMVRATLHRALSWSKAMSVSFSLFFPLATKWESPAAAMGAMATMASNWKFMGNLMRENPELFNGLTKMFPGSGWITKDFLGFSNVIEMMDSHSPFLAELVAWTHALGISLSSAEANPMEPQKSVMLKDIETLKKMLKAKGLHELARRFTNVTDALVTRQSEKAFTYALNATKLATVAQLAMKLRHEARKRGKAFDPIRDLRKYAGYINSEVGGIDQMRYAWAHPMVRGILNTLFFSWEWTRGAWEAGGGGVIEDLVFGGHSTTREERRFMLGRWARMWCEVMIGVPMLFQIFTNVAAMLVNAVNGGDDDDDMKWWTWQNEDKTKWTAFDLTPLLKALGNFETLRDFKSNETARAWDRLVTGAVGGGALGGALGGIGGVLAGGALGVGAANVFDARVGRLVPAYTGDDPANQTTRGRRYYMHFGKQGWEFFRWFDEPGRQFFSKLSMPTQRLLEGFIGRNMSWLDKELPWENMGALERWLDPTMDGALFNMGKAWLPFSVNGIRTFGDAGFFPVLGPVSMGASRTRTNDLLEAALERWANNDRRGYSFGAVRRRGKRPVNLAPLVQDILRDARVNGETDVELRLNNAIGQVMAKVYNRLFKALPRNPSDDFDKKEVETCCRMLNRLGARKRDVMTSMKKKFDSQGNWWTQKLTPDQRQMYSDIIGTGLDNAADMDSALREKWNLDY